MDSFDAYLGKIQLLVENLLWKWPHRVLVAKSPDDSLLNYSTLNTHAIGGEEITLISCFNCLALCYNITNLSTTSIQFWMYFSTIIIFWIVKRLTISSNTGNTIATVAALLVNSVNRERTKHNISVNNHGWRPSRPESWLPIHMLRPETCNTHKKINNTDTDVNSKKSRLTQLPASRVSWPLHLI